MIEVLIHEVALLEQKVGLYIPDFQGQNVGVQSSLLDGDLEDFSLFAMEGFSRGRSYGLS